MSETSNRLEYARQLRDIADQLESNAAGTAKAQEHWRNERRSLLSRTGSLLSSAVDRGYFHSLRDFDVFVDEAKHSKSYLASDEGERISIALTVRLSSGRYSRLWQRQHALEGMSDMDVCRWCARILEREQENENADSQAP